MKNKPFKVIALSLFVASFMLTSCQKEEAIAPTDTSGETILYIKAVRTDSSTLESERIILR